MNTGKQLRFADMIRVSTEKQEQQGESLHVQRKANERDVQRLGGKVAQARRTSRCSRRRPRSSFSWSSRL